MSLLPGATFQPLFLPRLGGGHFPLPLGPAVVFFFEADSPACAYAARAVARLAAALGPRGLEVVAVSRSDEGATTDFLARNGLSSGAVQVGIDLSTEPATNEFELDRVPTAFVVDQGTVLACVEGWSRRDFNALAAAAADVVGAPAPTASDPDDGMPDYEPGEARP
jgi:peroxiredoxin